MIKKRRYLIKVFAIDGQAVDDATLHWVVDDITGFAAMLSVKYQLQQANGFTDSEIAQYSFSATYLEDC